MPQHAVDQPVPDTTEDRKRTQKGAEGVARRKLETDLAAAVRRVEATETKLKELKAEILTVVDAHLKSGRHGLKEAALEDAARRRDELDDGTVHGTRSATDKVLKALDLIEIFDYAQQKQWLLDQLVRHLTGSDTSYEEWVRRHNAGEDGPNTYAWDVGISP